MLHTDMVLGLVGGLGPTVTDLHFLLLRALPLVQCILGCLE